MQNAHKVETSDGQNTPKLCYRLTYYRKPIDPLQATCEVSVNGAVIGNRVSSKSRNIVIIDKILDIALFGKEDFERGNSVVLHPPSFSACYPVLLGGEDVGLPPPSLTNCGGLLAVSAATLPLQVHAASIIRGRIMQRHGLQQHQRLRQYSRRSAPWRRNVRLEVEQLQDRSLLNAAGCEVTHILVGYQQNDTIDIRTVALEEGVSVEEALAACSGKEGVVFAEPDYQIQVALVPNDPSFSSLYGLHNTGQTGGTVDADIDAPEAWDLTTGSLGVVVGIIDTGIDYTHPDLYKNIWINQGEIPAAVRANLTDTDGDNLITFWDLNNAVNQGAGKIIDVNGNGRELMAVTCWPAPPPAAGPTASPMKAMVTSMTWSAGTFTMATTIPTTTTVTAPMWPAPLGPLATTGLGWWGSTGRSRWRP